MLQTVVSGIPYAVSAVDGRRPFSLTDFVGAHRLQLTDDGHASVIEGLGLRTGPDAVTFAEKRHGGGKDVREWRITGGPADGFRAEHEATF